MEPSNTQSYLSERKFSDEDHELSKLVHDFALNMIAAYTPEDIDRFVLSGEVPNLRIYKKLVPQHIRLKVFEQWTKNREKINSFFSYDELLFQCEDHRKDLLPVVSKPESKRWFTALIKFVEKVIIEDFAEFKG